jgi:hypothetical protein
MKLLAVGACLVALVLTGCTRLDPAVEADATEFADSQLGVLGSEVTDFKKGGECIVAEVTVPDGQTYRVIMVNQRPGPQPYEPTGISQLFTLDEFFPGSDVGCGIMKTDAYGRDANGDWAILG